MQWMHSKKKRDHEARPRLAGHAAQGKEQNDGGESVQQDVCEMVPAGIDTEELHVEHVREPGEGKPIGVAERGECPHDAVGSEAGPYLRVFGDVDWIVERNEVVSANLDEGGEDKNKDEHCKPDV